MDGKGFYGTSIEKCQEILLLLWVQSGTILRNEFTFTRSKQHALNFNKKQNRKVTQRCRIPLEKSRKSLKDKNKEQNAGGSIHDFRLN